MIKIDIEEQKQIQLNLLREIDSFCRKHSIKYMLFAGTLLGAVRHKGFIPWDDDIDLAMPREDYERFYREFKSTETDNNLKVISYRDKSSIYPFLKVIDKRTKVVEEYVDPKYLSGVWVDVFPIDGVDAGGRCFFQSRIIKLKHAIASSSSLLAATLPRRIVKNFLRALMKHPDPYEIAAEYDKMAQKNLIRTDGDVAVVVWGEGEKERMPISFLETTELTFEGRKYFAPKEYDLYLKNVYGNYMKLPPERERTVHTTTTFWL